MLCGMHANAARIQAFYEAFQRKDAEGMNKHYAQDVQFSDAVFTGLGGDETRAMWSMLCKRGKDLKVEFSDIEANDTEGRAKWNAWYTFSATGKHVHNVIEARFEFKDGLITKHQDSFDLTRWIAQAFGLPGRVLGGFGFFQNFVRGKAQGALKEWMKGPKG